MNKIEIEGFIEWIVEKDKAGVIKELYRCET